MSFWFNNNLRETDPGVFTVDYINFSVGALIIVHTPTMDTTSEVTW